MAPFPNSETIMFRLNRTPSCVPAPKTTRLELTALEVRENPAAWVSSGMLPERILFGANAGDIVVFGNRFTRIDPAPTGVRVSSEFGTIDFPVRNGDVRLVVFGTSANDTIVNNTSLSMLARGGGGNDFIHGGGGNDQLFGGDGNDTVFGEGGIDDLHGEDGDDTLDGGADNDRLFGEDGQDVLFGGTGDDILDGGSGTDRFVGGPGSDFFAGTHDSRRGPIIGLFTWLFSPTYSDTVVDLNPGEGDFRD